MRDRTKQSIHKAQAGHSAHRHGERLKWTGAILILAVPVLAAVGYGAVDVWAFIPLSVLTAALVAVWVIDGYRRRELRVPAFGLQIPFLGLILIGLVQLLPLGGLTGGTAASLSLDPYATRLFLIRLVLLFVFLSAAVHFLRDARARRFVGLGVVVFGAVIAFVGILQRLASPDAIYGMRPTPQAIPFGPFVNQHHFAAMMEMTLGLTFGFLFGGTLKREHKGLFMIAAVLMAIAVVMTGSRGGLLSSLAVAAAAVILSRREGSPAAPRRIWPGIAAAAGVLALVSSAVVFLQGADPLIRAFGLQANQTDPTSGRLHFWSVAWKIFADNPVIGAGYEAFAVAFTRYDTWNGIFRVEQAHNDYLQMLADGGVLAFACVIVFVYLVIKNGMAARTSASNPLMRSIAVGALAGSFGIIVHSLFDFPLRTPSNAYFVLLLAAILAVGAKGEDG
ncbi:MAG: O-antigen ligase family protein [Pyrinomonadaceae bacterium]